MLSKFVRSAKSTVVFKTLSQSLSGVALIVLIRALSENDYGVYNLFYSIIGIVGMIASFGLSNTLQRFIPEYYSKGEFRIAHNLYRMTSLIRLLANVVVLFLLLFLWDYLAPYLKLEAFRNYFCLFAVVIILHMQWGLLDNCLGAFFLQKYTQGYVVLFMAVKAVGYLCTILLNWDLWHVFIIDLAAYALLFSLLQIVYYRKIPTDSGIHRVMDGKERKRVFRYAAFYNFNDAGVGMLDQSFDNFIIAAYLNPVAVGAYSLSNRVTKLIERIMPVNYLADVIRPTFFTVGSSKGSRVVTDMFQTMIKAGFIFHLPVFFFLLVHGADVIQFVFTGKFAEYHFVLSAVFFFATLNCFQMPVGLVAQLAEKADIILYSKMFSIYHVVAAILLIKYLGIWGAVLANGTAVLGKNLYIWHFVRNEASLAGMFRFFMIASGYWAIIAAVMYAVQAWIELPIWRLTGGTLILISAFLCQFRLFEMSELESKVIARLTESNRFLFRIFNRTKYRVRAAQGS
jgi:O-antigen/teichoic acid export membrane protein